MKAATSWFKKSLTPERHLILTPWDHSANTPAPHKSTLIWLCGLGDTAAGFYPIFGSANLTPLPPSTKVILLNPPQIPITRHNGEVITAWYDRFTTNMDKSSYSIADVQKNAKWITEMMKTEILTLKNTNSSLKSANSSLKSDNLTLESENSQKLFIGGFSQGASLAFYCGLGFGEPLGGVIG
jgi:phospholipase/carboxylesterase